MGKEFNLKKMIPFLEDEELEELANKIIESETKEFKGVTINDLLPFLDYDYIGKIVKSLDISDARVTSYLPFMDDNDIDELVLKAAKISPLPSSFYSMLPFASDECLDEVVKLIDLNESEVDIDKLYPFLSDEGIKTLFKKMMKD